MLTRGVCVGRFEDAITGFGVGELGGYENQGEEVSQNTYVLCEEIIELMVQAFPAYRSFYLLVT